MARIPLQTLPAFRAAARLSNLREAAERLHLTHSAVSQQIKVLEEQLGFALFERRGRRIVLNPAGEAFLRSVEPALALLDDGAQAAGAAALGAAQRLRVTVLPSFAQRWLLPRMGRWRERHPALALEIEASHQVLDLQREGFHAAVRSGRGPWPGLESKQLFDQAALVVVGSKDAGRRLLGAQPQALAREPLLGDAALWRRWFAAAGVRGEAPVPVADFNDYGLMLQAAEQGLGVALARHLLAADAIMDGRLVQLSPLTLSHEQAYPYHLVYPPSLRDWPPIVALHDFLHEELDRSRKALARPVRATRAKKALAGR